MASTDTTTGQVVGQAISTLGNAAVTAASNRRQYKNQIKAMQEQQKLNLEMWERQNAYNSPQQQMERLKAAGLNPYLVYGQSSGGAAGQAGPLTPPEVPSKQSFRGEMQNPMQSYLSARQMDVQYEASRQSIENMKTKMGLDAVNTGLKNLALMKEQNRSKNYVALNQAEKRQAQLVNQRLQEMWNNEGLKGQLITQMHEQRAEMFKQDISQAKLDTIFKENRNALAKYGVYSSDNAILRTLLVASQRMGIPIDELLQKAPSALQYLFK